PTPRTDKGSTVSRHKDCAARTSRRRNAPAGWRGRRGSDPRKCNPSDSQFPVQYRLWSAWRRILLSEHSRYRKGLTPARAAVVEGAYTARPQNRRNIRSEWPIRPAPPDRLLPSRQAPGRPWISRARPRVNGRNQADRARCIDTTWIGAPSDRASRTDPSGLGAQRP